MLALASQAVKDKPRLRKVLLAVGIFGTSLFYGDGVITPAISVLSAVEGLEVVSPAFKQYVIPLTLVVLFCCLPCKSGARRASASSSGRSRWSGLRPLPCWAFRTSSWAPRNPVGDEPAPRAGVHVGTTLASPSSSWAPWCCA
jgi:hypothetical protein